MRLPYYFWRGVLAGLAVYTLMSFLINRLDMRAQQITSNVPVDEPTRKVVQQAPRRQTDFGGFLGVIVFALFCVVPGPYEVSKRTGVQEGPNPDQKSTG